MKLATWLGRKEISVDDFAGQIGVDPVSVRRYLKGGRRPRWGVMQKIIDVTGGAVTPNDFLATKSPKRKEKPPPSDAYGAPPESSKAA